MYTQLFYGELIFRAAISYVSQNGLCNYFFFNVFYYLIYKKQPVILIKILIVPHTRAPLGAYLFNVALVSTLFFS